MLEQIIVGGAVAAVTALCSYIAWAARKSAQRHAETKAETLQTRELLKTTMLSMVRQDIVKAVEDAYNTGYFTLATYESLTELVLSYRELGGNGTIEQMVRRVDERLRIERGIDDG